MLSQSRSKVSIFLKKSITANKNNAKNLVSKPIAARNYSNTAASEAAADSTAKNSAASDSSTHGNSAASNQQFRFHRHRHYYYHYGTFKRRLALGALFFTGAYAFDAYVSSLDNNDNDGSDGNNNPEKKNKQQLTVVNSNSNSSSYNAVAKEYQRPIFLGLLSVGIGSTGAIPAILLLSNIFAENGEKVYAPIFKHLSWAKEFPTTFKIAAPFFSPFIGLVTALTSVVNVASIQLKDKPLDSFPKLPIVATQDISLAKH